MMEIPESRTVAAQISKTLANRTIVDAVAASSPHGLVSYAGDPARYKDLLSGQTLWGAHAVGGIVELRIGAMRLLLQDGVKARYYAPDDILPAKHQLLLRFSDGSALVCIVQMYGGILLYEGEVLDNPYYKVALEKPDPLSEEFNTSYFNDLVKSTTVGKTSVKALLATEQRIPGLGNGCLQDILFHARVNPQSKAINLEEKGMTLLFGSIKRILRAMTEGGGRDTEKDFFGQAGSYHTLMSNKTYSKPCPICGNMVLRKTFLGGNIYYCPRCQPIK